MLQKNSHFPLWMTVMALYGLVGLAIFVVAALWTNQWVGLPAVLLVLVGWGGMFLLQVVLPIITVIQVLARLNRKLFCRA